MKYSRKNTLILTNCILGILFLCSCSSRYIKSVDPQVKTAFGITLTAPSQGIFFVQNKKVDAFKSEIEDHIQAANSIYNKYGPATDLRFVGTTNARQLKFHTKDRTYLIDITKFKRRTALVLFDGQRKPIIVYDVEKYNKIVDKHLSSRYK